jgi:hypothetical protein
VEFESRYKKYMRRHIFVYDMQRRILPAGGAARLRNAQLPELGAYARDKKHRSPPFAKKYSRNPAKKHEFF